MSAASAYFPRRHEIWRVHLHAAARGAELAAGSESRPALVVSLDDINEAREAITVALLTSYPFPFCDRSKKHWVKHWEHRYAHLARIAAVLHPPDKQGNLHEGGLSYAVGNRDGWNRTIVNCGALYTIAVRPPAARTDTDEVDWTVPCARVEHPVALENVQSGLQAAVGGAIGLNYAGRDNTQFQPPVRQLMFRTGDVVELDMPYGPGPCLIVSSASIDFLREHALLFGDTPPVGRDPHAVSWPLGLVTVVPLTTQRLPPGHLTRVDVSIGGTGYWILCSELYTVDWRARMKSQQKIGELDARTMARVTRAIRYVLGLPVEE